MRDAYLLLEEQYRKLARLDHALTFLQWDHMVMMPPGGSEPRARAIAELTALHHELLTSPETGDLLQEAARQATTPSRKQNLQEMEREYQRGICLPPELVKAKSLAGSKCEHGWRSQRKDNDWPGFLVNFKEVVELAREEAQARRDFTLGRFPTPYDAMLDLYCTGDDNSFISEIFATLKAVLPGLVQQVVEKQKGDSVPDLLGHYPIDQQKLLNLELMKCLEFNFDQGRLDVSSHPFSTGCRGDQRITTRFRETDFLDALMATAHETGHASYESGLPLDWDNLPAGNARNLCLHESQSLLFEKQIFLSRPFISFFSSRVHTFLPTTAAIVGSQLWAAATRVQPSYIRVEADEVTYPLHVILRYEIESRLINKSIQVEDIPEIWDEKMQEYFGLSTAGNYTDGCLQDMHWTDGSFGYFPSYTIGALNGAQLFASIRLAHPDWQERLTGGDISFIRNWLEETIWQKGSTMDSQDIIRLATGESTSPDYFLNHIQERYLNELY
ncbi:MAG: carboxypeptidase M32 [Desulfobulbaceae bacterium]|nr:carboxypeptidase M32 [Desulfobulbaceae bacterium]